MKAGDLVKHRGDGGTLVLVLEVAHHGVMTLPNFSVRILLNDGRRIWVGALMLEPINATR